MTDKNINAKISYTISNILSVYITEIKDFLYTQISVITDKTVINYKNRFLMTQKTVITVFTDSIDFYRHRKFN